MVLVDEGHREPAPQWAAAVRELDSPTILFTATPYRNDLQLFDIDSNHTYSFTYVEAVTVGIVRDVSFIDGHWPLSGQNVVADFTRTLLKSVADVARLLGTTASALKVIVRCENAEQIKLVVNTLIARGRTVVGIHETFGKSDGNCYMKDVPDPSSVSAQFWVHQNKLMEGIDDPSFRFLAIFGRFTNARNLVQQIGRIVRNPTSTCNEKAFVLAHAKQGQRALWDRFIEYESHVRELVKQGGHEMSALEQFLAARTEIPRFYLLGDFRKQLRPEDVSDPREIVRLRKSVLVRTASDEFRWKNFVTGIQHELLTGDAVPFGDPYQNQSSFLQLFQISDQSANVSEAYLEVRLGYVFARRDGDLVFFYDSEGRSPHYLITKAKTLSPSALERLLPDQASTIKELSLINGDFGNNTYIHRSFSTHSLEQVPPSLSDYAHICSTATGVERTAAIGSQNSTRRRYLSFARGRLSERTTPIVSYGDFVKWLDQVAEQLRDDALAGNDALRRFAKPHRYIGNEKPLHILFDVSSERIDATEMSPSAALPDDKDAWLVHKGRFWGEIEDRNFEATLQFNSETDRFEIESSQLDEVKFYMLDGHERTFTKYLNESQNFRILFDGSIVYTQGHFFSPNLLPWRGGGSRINIEKIIVGCDHLKELESEKGDLKGWTDTSVFGAITDRSKVFRDVGWTPEILVCNDVGAPEMADFLGLSESTKTIAMIHAKNAKAGSKASASAFHDICAQGTRYLGFFNPSDMQTKLREGQITGMWNPNASKYKQQNRLVWCPVGISAKGVLKKFAAAISDPTYSREVWFVMGNGLSRNDFVKAVGKQAPKPHEREMSYLLQSAWCSTASVGASLKVVCMP